MENIDDFMRQKFNNDPDAPGARFEFREEYWEQAQALIEADEARRRKRRRRMLWWLFAGLLAGLAGGYGIRQSDLHRKTGANNQEQQVTGVGIDADTLVHTGGSTNPKESGPTDTGPSKPGVPPAKQGLPGDQNNRFQPVDYQNFKSKKGGTASPSAISVSPPDRHTPIKENNIRQAPALRAAPGSNKTGQQGAGVGETYRKENAAETGGEKNAPPTANNTTSGADSSQAGVNGIAPAELPELSLENFPFIPTLLRFLNPLPRKPDISTPQPAPDIIRPVYDPRFAFGIQASASWYQPSPDKRRLGGTGGLFARYRLGADWSLSAGAQWRFLPGDWSGVDSLSSEQVRYSFGFKQDYWKLENRGLHFIEIPIGIGWKHRNLRFEGGLAPALLLGVQANLIRRHLESLQDDAHADGVVEKNRIWTDKAPYRAFYTAGFAGVEWQIARHWGISARGFYRPADLLKPSDVDIPGGGHWWLDTGLSWRF